jgi:hypothetical protein
MHGMQNALPVRGMLAVPRCAADPRRERNANVLHNVQENAQVSISHACIQNMPNLFFVFSTSA